MSNYSKCKDSSPEQTIFKIQSILNKIGLFTTVQWFPADYSGVYCNRVQIYGTRLGTNGKGTDEIYCLASGYAELMERIQNTLLVWRGQSFANGASALGIGQPDARMTSIEEMVRQVDPFTTHYASRMGCDDESETVKSISEVMRLCEETNGELDAGRVSAVPYVDLRNERVVWVPDALITRYYGSNGMAAGNTLEEAFVQGISEVLERYANNKILKGECVPPRIPDEALKPYSVWDVISQVRESGRYDVEVFDCSLGIGLPVSATMLIDKKRGTFGFKFGAHPSFAVSVERTLTEMFQGKSAAVATSSCTFGTTRQAAGYHNASNVMKIGNGVYASSVITGTPDWEYEPWTQWEGLDNKGFMRRMLQILLDLGFSPLLRDVSHLGFPSCQVIVPGMSDMFEISELTMRADVTLDRVSKSFDRFPCLTYEEEERFLRLYGFKRGSYLENDTSGLTLHCLVGPEFLSSRIAAYMMLKHTRYTDASKMFAALSELAVDREAEYLYCMSVYALLCAKGMEPPEAQNVISKTFEEDIAHQVCDEVSDSATIMQKVFPQLQCPDCDRCGLAGAACEKPQVAEVIEKICVALRESKVSQDELLEMVVKLAKSA